MQFTVMDAAEEKATVVKWSELLLGSREVMMPMKVQISMDQVPVRSVEHKMAVVLDEVPMAPRVDY